jgi:hypothetical protein
MKRPNAARDAALLDLADHGATIAALTARFAMTRNAVIGALWRERRRKRQEAMQKLWEDLRDGKDLVPVAPRKSNKPGPIARGFRMY